MFKERKFAFPALVLPVQIFSEYILSENIRTGSLICRFLCEIYGDQAVLWNISILLVFCIKYYAKFSVSNAQKHFLLIQFTDFFFCAKASSVQGQTLQEIFCHTFLVLQTNLSRKIIMWWKTDKEPRIREFIIHISK